MTKGLRPSTIVAGTSTINDVPKAPSWLSNHAKSEWKRVAPILVERKVLTEADLPILESYCVAVGMVHEAQTEISRDGITTSTAHGVKRHPSVGIQITAMNQCRLLANELGLTPVSRSRPALKDSNDEDLSFLD